MKTQSQYLQPIPVKHTLIDNISFKNMKGLIKHMTKLSEQTRLQILADLIKIQSVNDNELAVAQYLQQLFHQHHIEAKIIPFTDTRANLVVEIGSDGPILGISGHMDVVAPGDAAEWDSDPFTLTERDGKLYGRGTADMKSGLAALVIALIDIANNHLLKHGRIRLLATAGEELGAPGSQKLYEQGYATDLAALVIAEPSQDALIYAHKGSMNICITSTGQAAHSSMPDLGYNAINPLINVLQQANERFNNPQNPRNELLGPLVMNTTIISGGIQVNSIPAHAQAEMNIRTIPEFNNDVVVQTIQDFVQAANADGAHLTADIKMSMPSIYTTGQNTLVKLAKELGESALNWPVKPLASPGATDASNFLLDQDKNFPFIMFGPGETTISHKTNEYVNRDTYLTFIDLYETLFVHYLNTLH